MFDFGDIGVSENDAELKNYDDIAYKARLVPIMLAAVYIAHAFFFLFSSVYKGIMQDYFERNVFDGVPNAQLQLSFAGTFMEMFVDMMGPLVQILTSRLGIKAVLVMGGILMTLGLQMASLTSEV